MSSGEELDAPTSVESLSSPSENHVETKVLVVGSTGHVGTKLLKELHERKYFVKALVRDEKFLGDYKQYVDEVFVGEITDDSTLVDLCKDVKVVISVCGVRRGVRKPTFWEVDHQGNMNVLNRIIASTSVDHFMFISAFGGDKLRKFVPQIEARERVIDSLKELGRYSQRAVNWTVFRCNGLFRDLVGLFNMVRSGTAYLTNGGAFRYNPIHGADLAKVIADSIASRATLHKKEILVGGPEVFSQKEIVDLAFQVSRMTPKYRKVPNVVLSIAAKVSKVIDENASSMLEWALVSKEIEQIAPAYGSLKLEDYFTEIYKGHPSFDKPGFYDVLVYSGTVFEKFVEVEKVGTTISWEFKTTERDITFGVHKADSEKNIVKTMLKLEKAQSQTVPVEGKITVEEPGTYLLKWDNTYSKMTDKFLTYRVLVEQ